MVIHREKRNKRLNEVKLVENIKTNFQGATHMQKEVSSPYKLHDQACVQQNPVYLKEQNLSQKNP